MAITQNTYTGNGSTVLYSFTFPYIDSADVKVTLNGTITTAYIFANATTIQFTTAPTAGVAIRIYRETYNDEASATFFPGSSIKASDLNNNFTQTLYVVQEVVSRYISKIGDTMQGILNMGGFKITNLGAPTLGTDATTKTYVDTQDALKVSKAGDTMSGNLAMGGNKVTGLGSPSGSADAATKSYVDGYINTTYLGPSATDPTTRPGGAPLQVGDQYFNTDQNILKAWTGTVWVISAAAGSIVRWRKTASAGNTTLSGVDDLGITLSYVVGNEQVYLNGALQTRGVDYTAATGTSITFTPALLAGDVVELHAVQGYVSATITPGSINDALVAPAAGIQASKLSFTQTGAGAVARTVDSKLKEKAVSVKDFGAVGDGITNDTTSFAAAFAYLNSGSEPRALFIPSGNYLVNHSTCLITSSHRSLFGEGPTSRLITASIVNGAFGIKVQGISDTNHISDVLISDLAVVASGWTGDNGTNGIAINRADRCSVQRCTVLGDSSGQSWEQGIIFRDTNNGLIANNIVRRIRGNGISLDLLLGSEDTRGNLVVGNTISIVGDSGVGFHNNVRYSAAIGNVIDQPGQGGGTGIDIAGCNLCLFEGNVVSNSGQYGIRLLQNLSYRTVDNVVTGNTVYHPSTAAAFAAVQVSNTERNTITNNKIIGNSSDLSSRGIYVDYASTGTATHPVTSEALYKLRGTVIANNTIERFTNGMVLDAAGGITGATLFVDKNLFRNCTTGIAFNTGSSEKRFTLYGQNSYFDCTANVSSLTGGIVQDGDPLLETLAIIPCNVSTLGTETTVSTALLTRVPNANQQLIGYHRVSEVGAFDGQINYKSSAGTTLVSDVFGSVTNAIRSVVIPLTSNDLLTVSIQKTGSPPTGTVDCNGLSFTLATYY